MKLRLFISCALYSLNLFAAAIPDPTEPGKYISEQEPRYTFTFSIEGDDINESSVATTFPIDPDTGQKIPNRPLVFIMHGGGFRHDQSYCTTRDQKECYAAIIKHLASYGFVVVSADWQSGTWLNRDGDPEITKSNISEILKETYVRWNTFLSNEIVVIGHSRGGAAVMQVANHWLEINQLANSGDQSVNQQLQLKAVVSLAAFQTRTLATQREWNQDNVLPAALFMLGSFDRDVSSSIAPIVTIPGDPDGRIVKGSPFNLYDGLGVEYNGDLSQPYRDFIYQFSGNHDMFNAEYVDSNSYHVVGPINAFLQVHVSDDLDYQTYFSEQRRINSVPLKIKIGGKYYSNRYYQQHDDPTKLVLSNFENVNTAHQLFYGGVPGNASIGQVSVDNELDIDSRFSWEYDSDVQRDRHMVHDTAYLNVRWNDLQSDENQIRFIYNDSEKPNVEDYKYLSLRAGQKWDKSAFDSGLNINRKNKCVLSLSRKSSRLKKSKIKSNFSTLPTQRINWGSRN